MESSDRRVRLLSLGVAAARLGVPATWLRSEAQAGRLPHLKAGARFLFDLDAVEAELLRRARAVAPRAGGCFGYQAEGV